MKKLTLVTFAIAGASALFAQSTSQQTSTYTQCSSFYETIPLRDMPVQTEEQREKANAFRQAMEEKREGMRPKANPIIQDNDHKQSQSDPVIQSADGIKTLSAPLVKFDGEFNSGSCPNDPNGAVGPTQFVEMYNSSMAVYDKTGKLLKGPVDLASVFTSIPNDDGDPVVLYDKFADRWFISEFQTSTNPTGFSVGISKTNDATGAYYIYNFDKWTTNNYPDYLKFSIWTDGYYMTANLQPQQIMVLDRAMMLAGKTTAGMITQSYSFTPASFSGNATNSLWNDAKIMDCDASALPPYGTPTFLVFFTNTNSGGKSNSIIIDKLVHDTAKKTLTITKWDSLSPASFNDYFNSSNFATLSQPTVKSFSTKALDALDGAFNFRVPFLVFTGYNSVVLSNTVNVGHNLAAIRWYELRQNTSTLHFTINQQSTYNPTAGKNRFNGAIGMDQDGDIGLAYTMDDSVSTYPSICYTGRMFGDAASTMTGTETTAFAGSSPALDGTCGGTGSRWGDYSDMTLDPTDGITFWHINEYDKAGNPGNGIFSFRLTTPLGFTNPIDLTQFKVYQDGNYINVIANTLPSNDDVQVDLFDAVGKQLSSKTVKPSGNSINEQVSVNGIAMGVYFVRVGNLNYQRVFKVLVK